MTGTNDTTPKLRRSLRGDIVFAFVIGFACYLAWLLRDVLLLLYVSALFAVVLQPLVRAISRVHIGRFRPFRKAAIVVLILMVLAGLALFAFLAVPPVLTDLHEFANDMPARLPGIIDKLKHMPFASRVNLEDVIMRAETAVTQGATFILFSIKNWAGVLFDLAMGLILTVYFTLEGKTAYNWALTLFPLRSRPRLDATLRRAEVRMGRWLLGQCSLMLILGVVSTATYVALDVRYAYALGFLTGLLNIVPVLGAAVCIGLALLVAAIDSWGRVLGVAVFYVIYLNIENSYLIPRIMQSSVGLPGLAILTGLLIGSALAGVVGALVSVPTAVLVAVLIDEYVVRKDEAQAA